MPRTFLVAPDSFKGSLSAGDAAMIITRAIRAALPDAVVRQIPIADGGEGSVETLVASSLGYYVEAEVTGAAGEREIVPWGIIGGTQTAILEIASCAGAATLPLRKRDPRTATTYGLGELILEAIREGCTEILVGLGGSMTNDGGAGMAQALGIRLLDKKGRDLERGGAPLARLHAIDLSGKHPSLLFKKFVGVCDVDNPLLGNLGATRVFAKQKGASDEDLSLLEDALARFAEVIRRDLGLDVAAMPHGGAAGGAGAGLAAFLGADLCSGIEFILDRVGFDALCAGADAVITGEGKIDEQTTRGKAVMGVTARAARNRVPVFAFAGLCNERDRKLARALGLERMYAVTPADATEEEAMENAARNLEARVRSAIPGILRRLDRG